VLLNLRKSKKWLRKPGLLVKGPQLSLKIETMLRLRLLPCSKPKLKRKKQLLNNALYKQSLVLRRYRPKHPPSLRMK